MKDCVFCKIVSGEVPSYKIYEDEATLVFLDVAEDVDGHMLAVPKKHMKSILDCDGETLRRLMEAVQRVACHCVSACGYDGVNLLNASGEGADQSVPHFHIHIIPRRKGDGVNAWPSLAGSKRGLEEMCRELTLL